MDENLEAATDGGRIDDGPIAEDDPHLLEVADATQTRGGTEANAIGKLGIRKPALALELGQNFAIDLIHSTSF
jgi:hypothetical protein